MDKKTKKDSETKLQSKNKNSLSKEKQTNVADIISKLNAKVKNKTNLFAASASRLIRYLPIGMYSIDEIIGGGLPRGGIVEIFGNNGSGKTTLALHCIKAAQREGHICAFIDLEGTFNKQYAKKIGINLDKCIIYYPESGEQMFQIIDGMIKEGVGMVVVDSVAAIVTDDELDSSNQTLRVGGISKLMSSGIKRISNALNNKEQIVIFINQIRKNIVTFGFGNPDTTPGGLALGFYSSLRIKLINVGKIKSGENTIGNNVRVQIEKNKNMDPDKKSTMCLFFGKGFSEYWDIVTKAVEHGILSKSGAWYKYLGENVACGSENLLSLLEKNQDLYEKIKTNTIEAAKSLVGDVKEVESDDSIEEFV